jgi:hypothetical protein
MKLWLLMSALGHKRTSGALARCPLYPQKRTLISGSCTSASAKERRRHRVMGLSGFDLLAFAADTFLAAKATSPEPEQVHLCP